ncbi:MAG: hypothetical protein OQL19_09460 [Gammaproteobacteria bacterium]|nr:hypothetical protein [Gammaproteobacteria bacterium]
MSNDEKLCPFSKPIIGKWCRCQYARLSDRCAGKMHCQHPDNHLDTCKQLVLQLEKNTRFILGISSKDTQLTHQQYMKIKCGGMEGMQRVLKLKLDELPSVTGISTQILKEYTSFDDFPYGEIVRDIADFKHRKSAKK